MDRPHWSNQIKLVVSLLLLAFFVYLLTRFSLAIPPLIIAAILAYILTPIVNFLQRKLRTPRPLAILLCFLLVLILLVTLPAGLIPLLGTQFSSLNLDIQRLIQNLPSFVGHRYTFAGITIDTDALLKQFSDSLQGFLEPVIGQTLTVVVELLASLVQLVLIFVVTFYLIKDGDKLSKWIEEHVPPPYLADYLHLRDNINTIWSSFFRGQLLLGLVVATIITSASFLLGLPFALAFGVLAGLLEFLPSVGHGIWLTLASIIALFLGSTWLPIPNWAFMLIVIGLHIIFEQFDLNYLIPRIIGRSVHLPPLVVILGIVAGALIAGVLGIFLAAPTIASARVFGRYIFANLFDMEPFPINPAPLLPPPNPRWWKRMNKQEYQ
jgi:predicted PurR-regulated permease PerM